MVSLDKEGPIIEDAVEKRVSERTQLLKGRERALLFCLSRPECDRMAGKLTWRPYHADISIDDRDAYLQEWRSGKVLGLVCTSMLNCCLDYKEVRLVFHLGVPRDAVDYWQAIGRASRDHIRGESIVYFDPTKCRIIKGPDPFGEAAIHDTLRDSATCRRLRLALFLDGTAAPCAMLSGGQLCDVCEKEVSGPAPPVTSLFPARLLKPPPSTISQGCSSPKRFDDGSAVQNPTLSKDVKRIDAVERLSTTLSKSMCLLTLSPTSYSSIRQASNISHSSKPFQ
jgi:hypothetical protein